MDVSTYKNLLVISEEKSISKAADKLFITRTALNRQLLAVENEIGAPLFKRIYNSLELTEIGRIYIKTAEKICDLIKTCEKDITNHLELNQDKIFVGVSSGLSKEALNHVLTRFHEFYPNIMVSLTICNSNEQRKQLTSGKIDIAIITLPDVTSDFQYEILDTWEVLLLMSKEHPLAGRSGKDAAGQYHQCELSWFKDDYFALEAFDTPLRYISEKIFFRSDFKPKIFVDNCGYSLLLRLASAGNCCIINSEKSLAESPSLVGFGFEPRVFLSYAVAYRNHYVLSNAEKKFVELVNEYYPSPLSCERRFDTLSDTL